MAQSPPCEEDQQEILAFLRGLEPCTQVTTHASHVFLYGERVLKLKRALRYAYLDFSTPEKRIADCERELAINRRFTPRLYLGLRRITRNADGVLQFDGAGEALDGWWRCGGLGMRICFRGWWRGGAPRLRSSRASRG